MQPQQPPETVSGPRERRYTTRKYPQAPVEGSSARESFLAFGLAVLVFLLVASFSAAQTTSRGSAERLLEPAIATTTEADILLRESLEPLKRSAQASSAEAFTLPGYPIEVYLSRSEVLTLDEPALRVLLLERSTDVVYDDGIDAFDRTGNQSAGLFSAQWAMDLVIGRLTGGTHDMAVRATFLLSGLAVVAGVFLLLLSEGFSGFRRAGFAVAAGALMGLLLNGAVWLIVGQIGGSDPFVADLRTLVRAVIEVPLRNYGLVALLGLFIAAVTPALNLAARRLHVDFPDDPSLAYASGPDPFDPTNQPPDWDDE